MPAAHGSNQRDRSTSLEEPGHTGGDQLTRLVLGPALHCWVVLSMSPSNSSPGTSPLCGLTIRGDVSPGGSSSLCHPRHLFTNTPRLRSNATFLRIIAASVVDTKPFPMGVHYRGGLPLPIQLVSSCAYEVLRPAKFSLPLHNIAASTTKPVLSSAM